MVSDELIWSICRLVVHADGLTADECDAVVEFLIHRKDRVLGYIHSSKGAMPNVRQWDLCDAS